MKRKALAKQLREFADALEKEPGKRVFWKVRSYSAEITGRVEVYSEAGSDEVHVDMEMEDDG